MRRDNNQNIFNSSTATNVPIGNPPTAVITADDLRKLAHETINETTNITETNMGLGSEGKKRLSPDIERFNSEVQPHIDNPDQLNTFLSYKIEQENNFRTFGMTSDEKWKSLLLKGREAYSNINTDNPGSYSNFKTASEFLLQNFEIFRQIRNNRSLYEKSSNNTLPNIGIANSIQNRFLNKDNNVNPIPNNNTVGLSNLNVSYKAEDKKPLGEWGEMTLNQAYIKGYENLLPIWDFYKEHQYQIFLGSAVISSLFIYKNVVKLYSSATKSSYDMTNPAARERRVNDIKHFMLYTAPVIALGIYGANQYFSSKLIAIKTESVTDDSTSNITNNHSFLPFLSRQFNKLPVWLKSLFIGYGIYYSIKYLYPDFFKDVNMGSIFFIGELFWKYSYVMKFIFLIGNIHNVYCIIKFTLTIYLFILFSKDKIEIPVHLPTVTLNWLDYIKIASKTEDKGQFIELHLRYIFVYLIVFCFYSFILYLLYL